MKTIKPALFLLILFFSNSCINQKQTDEEQIRETVRNYWIAVKNNNLQACKDLIYESEGFSGAIQGELYFLHKNYEKINKKNVLLKNIVVKDTTLTFSNAKEKYVQYTIKQDNDTNNIKKPLVITFTFYKPVGYNKIFNGAILKNHINWNKTR